MKNFKDNFLLRAALLRVWFMKNIMVFLKAFLAISLILMFTGNITENTFLIGWIVYPIFQPLVDGINSLTSGAKTLMDIVSVILSVVTTVGLFSLKAKSIALTDIKSAKLKVAIIKAGLYFDKNGKLVKKTDEIAEDHIGEVKVNNDNLITGIKQATDEFFTVISAKAENPDSEETMSENKTSEELLKMQDDANEELKETIEDTMEDGVITEKEKVNVVKKIFKSFGVFVVTTIKGIGNLFKFIGCKIGKIFKSIVNIFKKKDKEETVETESSENEEIVVVAANIEEPEKIEDEAKVEEKPTAVETEVKEIAKNAEAIKKEIKKNEFLERLKNLRR